MAYFVSVATISDARDRLSSSQSSTYKCCAVSFIFTTAGKCVCVNKHAGLFFCFHAGFISIHGSSILTLLLLTFLPLYLVSLSIISTLPVSHNISTICSQTPHHLHFWVEYLLLIDVVYCFPFTPCKVHLFRFTQFCLSNSYHDLCSFDCNNTRGTHSLGYTFIWNSHSHDSKSFKFFHIYTFPLRSSQTFGIFIIFMECYLWNLIFDDYLSYIWTHDFRSCQSIPWQRADCISLAIDTFDTCLEKHSNSSQFETWL